MRPPLDNWTTLPRGYRFGERTFYNDFHIGLDVIVPVGTLVHAPESGQVVSVSNGPQGGLALHFLGVSGKLHRFLHLSSVLQSSGHASEGEPLAKTGNSGSATTRPHWHGDISRNGQLELNNRSNFIDPETLYPMTNYDDHIIRNRATGSFAFVKDGKKQEFNNSNGALAQITFLDRLPSEVFPQERIKAVDPAVYDAIPNTTEFFPPISSIH